MGGAPRVDRDEQVGLLPDRRVRTASLAPAVLGERQAGQGVACVVYLQRALLSWRFRRSGPGGEASFFEQEQKVQEQHPTPEFELQKEEGGGRTRTSPT